jgi:hypothetical protein
VLLPLPQPPQRRRRQIIQKQEEHPPLQSLHPPQFVAAKSLILNSSGNHLQ